MGMNVTVKEIEHLWIKMSDGVRLSARLWLPEDPKTNKVPAILEYIPYRKRDMVRIRDERNHKYFAQHGYACLRVDMRGSGDSEGLMSDMYSTKELDDAVEVVEWISEQIWCNGSVGMMGTSWGGTSALQTATRQPRSLKAIIAVCATNNRYGDDIHHMGGGLLTDTVEWGATLPAILASPPDPDTVGENWRTIWTNRLNHSAFPLENWIKHEKCNEYWRWGSVNETPDAILCPVLLFGGWADRYSNTVMNLLADSHKHCWGIVGPWGHHYPSQASPGPGIGFQQEALKWWDYWLKGVENGITKLPKLRTWMLSFDEPADKLEQRSGYWISEPRWPSENVKNHRYYFDNNRLISSRPVSDSEIQIPWSLKVGKDAGDTGYFGRSGGLPVDQKNEDEHSLVFDTEPLSESLEILGKVILKIAAKLDDKIGTIAVRLNDVSPNGSIARVNWAVQNLALTDGQPSSKRADGIKQLSLSFPNIAYRFEKGHKIRIAFSCIYWPMIWPPPKPTNIKLLLNEMSAFMPVRKKQENDAATQKSFASVSSTDWAKYQMLEAGVLSRKTEFNETTQEQSVAWHQSPISVYYPKIKLEFGYETVATHLIKINDANSALTQYTHTLRFVREKNKIEVNSMAKLTSSESQYYLSGELKVIENGKLIFSKQWHPVLAREYS